MSEVWPAAELVFYSLSSATRAPNCPIRAQSTKSRGLR